MNEWNYKALSLSRHRRLVIHEISINSTRESTIPARIKRAPACATASEDINPNWDRITLISARASHNEHSSRINYSASVHAGSKALFSLITRPSKTSLIRKQSKLSSAAFRVYEQRTMNYYIRVRKRTQRKCPVQNVTEAISCAHVSSHVRLFANWRAARYYIGALKYTTGEHEESFKERETYK